MQLPSLRGRLALIGLTIGAVLLALGLAGYGLASAAPTPGSVGVIVVPATASTNAARGSVVTYTLRMTNTGTLADVYTTTVTGHTWPTTYTITSPGTAILPLAPGAGQNVLIYVTVPLTATGHDVAVFTARSGLNPAVLASSTVTTTVSIKTYAPLIRK